MLAHVIATAESLQPAAIHVVYGHGGNSVRDTLVAAPVDWIEQTKQLGTGHAVQVAMPGVSSEKVLVLYGDVPLIRSETLGHVIQATAANAVGLLTLEMDDPAGYGRIQRNRAGQVQRIIEQKDANEQQLAIREINTGILCLPRALLDDALPRLSSNNAQGEYYLTDLIEMAVDAGLSINTIQPTHAWEVDGVNDRVQLARLERIYQSLQAEELMRAGVSLADPARFDLRGELDCGEDVYLDVNTVIEGRVRIGRNVRIGPNCLLRNSDIADHACIEANSIVDGAQVGEQCTVGPFARLRPGTVLAARAKVGNFVETKQAQVGEGSKINHLSYIGDAELGADVNVGAGTITCNYDGANKSTTRMGDRVFIGSNSSLVAPLTIADDATVGAGSVITRDIKQGELGVARGKQRNVSSWQRPRKKDT